MITIQHCFVEENWHSNIRATWDYIARKHLNFWLRSKSWKGEQILKQKVSVTQTLSHSPREGIDVPGQLRNFKIKFFQSQNREENKNESQEQPSGLKSLLSGRLKGKISRNHDLMLRPADTHQTSCHTAHCSAHRHTETLHTATLKLATLKHWNTETMKHWNAETMKHWNTDQITIKYNDAVEQ